MTEISYKFICVCACRQKFDIFFFNNTDHYKSVPAFQSHGFPTNYLGIETLEEVEEKKKNNKRIPTFATKESYVIG